MELFITFGGWLLVVAVALIFAGLYFDTRSKLKQEQKDRAELKDAFTRLQEQYQEVCLDRERLQSDVRQIAQDRDKAYDKVDYLKRENAQVWSLLEAANKQLNAIQFMIQQHGYVWDTTIPTSENVAAYFATIKAQSDSKRDKALYDLDKAKGMVDGLVAAAREIKPRGTTSKATYQRLQDALHNFREGGAA